MGAHSRVRPVLVHDVERRKGTGKGGGIAKAGLGWLNRIGPS